MSVQNEFEKAAARAKSLPEQSDDTLLSLYALYKQATSGDVTGEAPGFFDFVGRAKYDAWEKRRGMTREEAMQAYTDLVNTLAGPVR